MGTRNHGQPQRVRHAFPVRLAVGREREHRLEEGLELKRRADFADEADMFLACIPETMRRSGLDHGDLARPERHLLASHLEAELSRCDGEALALGGVDVRGGDEPVRLHDGLDQDRVAVGVGRGGEEGDALAGDRVLDGVTCADHVSLLLVDWDPEEARTASAEKRRPRAGLTIVLRSDLTGAPPPPEGRL